MIYLATDARRRKVRAGRWRRASSLPARTHVCSLLSPAHTRTLPHAAIRMLTSTQRARASRGEQTSVPRSPVFPFGKQISWHIPFASSLGSAEEEEEEEAAEEPAQPDRARAAAWATAASAERLLPAAGLQMGTWRATVNARLLETVSGSLVGINSQNFRPSVCCRVLGHMLQLV